MSRELWPPRQLPLIGPQWKLSGSKCRARGCGATRQAWAVLPYLVKDGSPQGEWLCDNGHRGWINARDCEACGELWCEVCNTHWALCGCPGEHDGDVIDCPAEPRESA